MGEDRRPNVGGRTPDQDPDAPRASLSDEQLELEAKSLKKRTSVDGHRKKPAGDEPG